MTTVLFVGPSLPMAPGEVPAGLLCLPPAGQGAVLGAVRDGASRIGLVDGVFAAEPAVWHKEILFAITEGVEVLGAASMGALRAAELDAFGMTGVGWIYEAYRDGVLDDDDEVAVLHGPAGTGWCPLSEPMVNVRRTLDAAIEAGVLALHEAMTIVRVVKARFYPERTQKLTLAVAGEVVGDRRAALVARWLKAQWVDQKRLDAAALLARLAVAAPLAEPAEFTFQASAPWRALCAEQAPELLGGASTTEVTMAQVDQTAPAAPMVQAAPSPPPSASAIRSDAHKRWALLTYVAADNNLDVRVAADIREMKGIGSTPRVHVAAEVYAPTHAVSGRLLIPPVTDRPLVTYYAPSVDGLVDLPEGMAEIVGVPVEPQPTRSSGDPSTIEDFLQWGLGSFPADHRYVIIWGHGRGWELALDEGTGQQWLKLDGLARAMRRTAEHYRRPSERPEPISILGFDACLMSTVETMTSFAGLARIIVASQELVPAEGLPYRAVIEAMDYQGASAWEIAAKVVDRYVDEYVKRQRIPVTAAAIDVGKASELSEDVSRLGDHLASLVGERRIDLEVLRQFLSPFASPQLVDLMTLVRMLPETLGDDRTTVLCKQVEDAARDCIVHARSAGSIDQEGFTRPVMHANGISVWYPATASFYKAHRADYVALPCFQRGRKGWLRFLDALHGVKVKRKA